MNQIKRWCYNRKLRKELKLRQHIEAIDLYNKHQKESSELELKIFKNEAIDQSLGEVKINTIEGFNRKPSL